MDTDMSRLPATSATSETCSNQLKWRRGNAKLNDDTYHLSIPAGWSCKPWATECYAHASPTNGKITDGKHQTFRCYAATMESIYPQHRKSLWGNWKALLYHIHEPHKLYNLMLHSLSCEALAYKLSTGHMPKVRMFGTSGDFWHENMYLATLALATKLSSIKFYWYTKAIPLWIKHADKVPPNVEQNASLGGRYDNLIYENNLKYAKVVYSFEEANRLGLPIDKRDELASEPGGSFAIPIHGVQPKGSAASKALQQLKKKGFHGYSKRKAS